MSKSKDAAPTLILKYLNDQNRPYSAQDVFGNLQREHNLGKTAVVKALENLTQQRKIKEKVYGKQKIYFADQDQFPAVSEVELKSLDSEISEVSKKVETAQQNSRQMETELKELNSSMTTQELTAEIKALNKECVVYQERLRKIQSSSSLVTPEEKEKVFDERKQYVKEWRKRKRLATDLIDAILEGYPKSKKQFFEEVGIETDEDFKVTVPDA
ncbi:homologous-pairing protein 2 homolog [Callorhinchus milii]|uniref:Homologous-pairing protein 2 homolog n=1 Tax=Callorhinchus milii TaxID=7868 RepID=K4G0C1_CALMI|nr:homologous-pairing protein 2 homolog [Callorhinchus milii]AFK11006.1 TBP-1 interacting protein isoform 2 isoform 2 [Callorhinchus milii]